MKVAIYARYCSDNQRDASIADQLRICREFAGRQGWTVVQEFTDHAISGATLLRSGFQAMMRDALNRRFDVVLAESLDRFSRDQEDTAGLFKRLTFAGVNIVTLAEGDITHLHIGFKGTMNALFLKDLAEKTHRGLRGRVEASKSASGLCYGYRVVKLLSGGTVTTGEREIDPAEAAIVERIFREFVAGVAPKAIARRLNRDGIGGPFGGTWSPSTIHGNAKRGTGILNNEHYVGRFDLEPTALREESGHGQADLAVESASRVDHQGDSVPPDTERQTLERREGPPECDPAHDHTRRQHRVRETASVSVLGALEVRRLRCWIHHGRPQSSRMLRRSREGTCSNHLTIRRDEVEARVLKALEEKLLNQELFEEFCDEFTREMNRLRMQHRASLSAAEREIERIEVRRKS
jgi:site-specific DNA recombinase